MIADSYVIVKYEEQESDPTKKIQLKRTRASKK